MQPCCDGWERRGCWENACGATSHLLAFGSFPFARRSFLEFLTVLETRLHLLPLVDADEDWRERSLCAQTDPEAFFPEKGGSSREAKKVCQSCEVSVECLESALENDERFGVWGGTSELERRAMRRERRAV